MLDMITLESVSSVTTAAVWNDIMFLSKEIPNMDTLPAPPSAPESMRRIINSKLTPLGSAQR